ncbi:PTPLA-domain-containing protein [Plenodomus tracheiphilus IPT5]|uniref:Very-long-chain (3R)-3-hydroxyacyl-CoA dehydratase n=1 Tax=Plenodomus tracheiphilus IPT5 TaxID=1408161 RepID=A0A6A7ASW3_9PLEO|nr:PTPLA-domain-containing protein [Plenodomus tracheiphilus IPT5]
MSPRVPWTPRTLYLTTFNTLFSTLWFSILVNALSHSQSTKQDLFIATEAQIRWLQTATLIEIIHSATGLIKSPTSTTFIQVTTRVIQVWLIWYTFPASTAASSAYYALVLAWSVADGVRYAYLALNMHGVAPGWLVWVRYTMFYILYPIGIGAEWWLFYQAIEPAQKISGVIPPIFYFLLALYVPGAYKMYSYMIKQRRKTLGGKQRSS